jgi:mannose-6-phosphate isomerase-like protein (cupin superfamily)
VSEVFTISELVAEGRVRARSYHEFLRVSALSAGVYVLPAGTADAQQPHRQDELYYVIRGKARIKSGDRHIPVQSGSVIYVEAGLEHRFIEIEEELQVLVMFAPAEAG